MMTDCRKEVQDPSPSDLPAEALLATLESVVESVEANGIAPSPQLTEERSASDPLHAFNTTPANSTAAGK